MKMQKYYDAAEAYFEALRRQKHMFTLDVIKAHNLHTAT